MKDLYIKTIAARLSVRDWQVENCAKLFEDGATIPFISRYRKEKTGGLDDVAVAEIRHWIDVYAEMEKRKESILATIRDAGKLTEDLERTISECVDSRELEDLYLPFRPKRRTRATVAREAGLEPLAEEIFDQKISDPMKEAGKFLNENPFWSAMIEQIYVEKNGDIILSPKVGKLKIIFGAPENIEIKFRKLLAFYKNIAPEKGWERYNEVNLKYRGQIVCKLNTPLKTKES